MSAPSNYRTEVQQAAIDRAISVGYKHDRDSDYTITYRRTREVKGGCLAVLFGRVTGHERSMIVYPDGSVVTAAATGSSVKFKSAKLNAAIASHGHWLVQVRRGIFRKAAATERTYTDEDDMFQVVGRAM